MRKCSGSTWENELEMNEDQVGEKVVLEVNKIKM